MQGIFFQGGVSGVDSESLLRKSFGKRNRESE